MSQYSLYSEFEWLNKKEISRFCEISFSGYILEVEYPDKLNNLHNDYPLAR